MKQNSKNKFDKGVKRSFAQTKARYKSPSHKTDIVIEDTLEQRLYRAIEKSKAISELIIGYIPYTFSFIDQKLNGTTNKPAKISALEKAIVGIINIDGQSSFSTIGKIMGLDILHDLAEKKMLRDAIDSMIRYKLIDGDESAYFITEQGKEFAANGERMSTFSADFELWYLNNKPDFTSLRDCVPSLEEAALIDKEEMFPEGEQLHILSFEEIKNLSEAQASNMQSSKERYILQSATVQSTSYYKYKVTVCFVQSIRTKTVRPIVYDDNTQTVISSLSDLIDKDDDLKQTIFNRMLESASEITELSVYDDINAAHAQIDSDDLEKVNAAEQKLIAQEDDNANETTNEDGDTASDVDLSERLHKRALYDSIAFEAEIHTIFQNDNPDEVWLSSPWVSDSTFMRNRLPLVRNYLNKGGKVFVSYSAPDGGMDSHKDKMVGEKSQHWLSKLEKDYPKQFFYVELPAFHKKNVIEVKNGQCILFTGSFNVLSFSVTSKNVTHVRAEEMCLAHYQAAINQYKETKRKFAEIYISKAKDDFINLNADQLAKYNNAKLLYFRNDENLAELFIDFDNAFEERKIQIESELLLNTLESYKREIDTLLKTGVNSSDVKNYRIKLFKLSKEFEKNGVDDSSLNDVYELLNKLGRASIEAKPVTKQSRPQKISINNSLSNNQTDYSAYVEKALGYYNEGPQSEEKLLNFIISLYYLTLFGNPEKTGIADAWKKRLLNFLVDDKWKGHIDYGMTKEKLDGYSRISVVMNDYLFSFRNISVPKKLFFKLTNNKKFINFSDYKEANKSIFELIDRL